MTPRTAPRDGGYTLIETALTCLVISIVLAAAFPVVPVFFRESTAIQNTYNSVDQLVLASEVVTRYIHEAVDPSPVAPVSPFASASANATTFYANTGNPKGPQKIVVQVQTSPTQRSFLMDLYTPTAGTCPTTMVSVATCTYTASTQSILLINFLTNGTGGVPVFTYTLQGGGTCGGPPPATVGTKLNSALTSGQNYSSLSVASVTAAITSGDTLVIGTGANTQVVTATSSQAVSGSAKTISVTSFTANANYATNTSVYDNTCSATQITQIVAVALNLAATKMPGGQPTGYQSLAYLFSPAFNPAVG